jgi:CheY-like chemotaxis protein
MGYEAITTSDPEEALSLVRTGRSRLVLADVNMPGMTNGNGSAHSKNSC